MPCGCGTQPADWPYDLGDYSPDTDNGLNCGDDLTGAFDLMWAEPSSDVGAVFATKALAQGLGADAFVSIGAMSIRAGEDYFDDFAGVFTAPRAGMWSVTFSCQPSDDMVDEAFFVYLKATSDKSAWGDPYLQQATPSEVFTGGGAHLNGLLPCDEGGTVTFELFHSRSGNLEIENATVSATWLSPLPS